MKTVIILAEALSKAAFSPIVRLDIHLVKKKTEMKITTRAGYGLQMKTKILVTVLKKMEP